MTDNRDWIGRVREADADAEAAWAEAMSGSRTAASTATKAFIAIAAELRAQRISKRPGAGTATVPGAPTPP